MRQISRFRRATAPSILAALLFTAPPQRALAVEPGVDIAVPRVGISNLNNSFTFTPANFAVEQGDYVRWVVAAGTTASHTTTSGLPCVANNVWNAPLSSTSPQFTRQFLEPPQVMPYFCVPHCGLRMTGQVAVTTPIALTAANAAGISTLTWSGGGPLYQVFRSPKPAFLPADAVILPPDAGDTGTTFTDSAIPPPGGASFYLVMNKP